MKPAIAGILIALGVVLGVSLHPSHAEQGLASWYGGKFHGRRTASGERYNQDAATCAHRTYRFGTGLRVTNLQTGKTTTCRVNDRGPFVRGRIVDLSRAGAQAIGLNGLARVTVERLPTSNCMILPRGSSEWRSCVEMGRGF